MLESHELEYLYSTVKFKIDSGDPDGTNPITMKDTLVLIRMAKLWLEDQKRIMRLEREADYLAAQINKCAQIYCEEDCPCHTAEEWRRTAREMLEADDKLQEICNSE